MFQALSKAGGGRRQRFYVDCHGGVGGFRKGAFPVEPQQTDILDLALQRHENLQLQMPVIEHQPDDTIIFALGIEFFIHNRGSIEPVDKKHNALAVVKVF